MTRQEHLDWCKKRALEYVDRGDIVNAVTSMMSDMSKHPDCGVNPAIYMLAMVFVRDNDVPGVRRWIIGFN